MKKSGKIALCGIVSALCVVCMFLTGVFPYATYALPALAGILLTLIVIEVGKRYAVMVYVAVSLLSLILAPDPEAKLVFVAFFGYYPILKAVFESLHRPYFAWGLKFCVFNCAVIGAYFVAIRFFSVSPDEFELFGMNLPLLFLVLGNVFFFFYDVALTRMIRFYAFRFHHRIQKLFRSN